MIGRMLPILLAAMAVSEASAFALPQGVTALIAPTSKTPETCSLNSPSPFGLTIIAAEKAPVVESNGCLYKRQDAVTQIGDGQIQAGAPAPANSYDHGLAKAADNDFFGLSNNEANKAEAVTQIEDGQIQAGAPAAASEYKAVDANWSADSWARDHATDSGAVTQIADGQIQAGAPAAPGYGNVQNNAAEAVNNGDYSGSFVTQIEDGQIQAGAHAAADIVEVDGDVDVDVAAASGVYEAGSSTTIKGSSLRTESTTYKESTSISSNCPETAHAVTQIEDGQIQAGAPVAAAEDVSVSYGDEFKAPADISSAGAVTQIEDGQIQAAADSCNHGVAEADNVDFFDFNKATDQIDNYQSYSLGSDYTLHAADNAEAVTQIGDGQIQAAPLVKRQNGSPLTITLVDGVLKDHLGRSGYIADNRQFQFDGPPQSGAIYTSGWSVCDDGALALGSQKQFWACGSSDFNNLYDEEVFPGNCHPVTIQALGL